MKINKTEFAKLMRANGFDSWDIEYVSDNVFDEKDEAEAEDVLKRILHDVEDSLNKEYGIRASGDISYIIRYLERYNEVVTELEDLANREDDDEDDKEA